MANNAQTEKTTEIIDAAVGTTAGAAIGVVTGITASSLATATGVAAGAAVIFPPAGILLGAGLGLASGLLYAHRHPSSPPAAHDEANLHEERDQEQEKKP